MSTEPETMDDLLERLRDVGRVTAKKMFGEYCLYLDGRPVGLVCDDILYIKLTGGGRALLAGAAEAPPYPGAKPHLRIPVDMWGDGALLRELVRTTYQHLPRPKLRKRRAPRRASGGRAGRRRTK